MQQLFKLKLEKVLQQRTGRALRHQLLQAAMDLGSAISALKTGAKTDPFNVGRLVDRTSNIVSSAIPLAIKVAAAESDKSTKKFVLENLKDVVENAVVFMDVLKAACASQNVQDSNQHLEETETKTHQSLARLSKGLEGSVARATAFSQNITAVESATRTISQPVDAAGTYQNHADKVSAAARNSSILPATLSSNHVRPISTRRILKRRRRALPNLPVLHDLHWRHATTPMSGRTVKTASETLGAAVVALLEAARQAQSKYDVPNRQKVSSAAREMSVQIANLTAAAKQGSKGLGLIEERPSTSPPMPLWISTLLLFSHKPANSNPLTPPILSRHKDALWQLLRLSAHPLNTLLMAHRFPRKSLARPVPLLPTTCC